MQRCQTNNSEFFEARYDLTALTPTCLLVVNRV